MPATAIDVFDDVAQELARLRVLPISELPDEPRDVLVALKSVVIVRKKDIEVLVNSAYFLSLTSQSEQTRSVSLYLLDQFRSRYELPTPQAILQALGELSRE